MFVYRGYIESIYRENAQISTSNTSHLAESLWL